MASGRNASSGHGGDEDDTEILSQYLRKFCGLERSAYMYIVYSSRLDFDARCKRGYRQAVHRLWCVTNYKAFLVSENSGITRITCRTRDDKQFSARVSVVEPSHASGSSVGQDCGPWTRLTVCCGVVVWISFYVCNYRVDTFF